MANRSVYIAGSSGSDGNVTTGGAVNVITYETGDLISQAALTLSASSQALPTVPATAKTVIIQTHGGTIVASSTGLSKGSEFKITLRKNGNN